MRRPGSVRYRNEQALVLQLESAVLVIEDEPGDYFRRVCKRCGAPIRGYILKRGSVGREVIRCTGGHFVSSWDEVPN